MKFLDVRTDFAFKKVFGSQDSKPRLISFLNAIINFGDQGLITDLEIVDPYNLPQLKGMKDTYVDVKAVLENETTVIIEMQVLNHQGFENRVLYNTAKNYSAQLVKGQRYDLLKPVVALTIVNFDMFKDNDELINYFQVLNKKDFTEYSDDIELVFVELNKFNKTQDQCLDIQDQWIYFLKNAGSLNVIPKNLPPQVETAYEVSNEAGMTPEELEIQYKKQEYIAIQVSSMQQATEKGLQQGREQGIELGKEQGIELGIEQGIELGRQQSQLEIVKAMKQQNLDSETISKITGLDIEFINQIQLNS